MVKQTAALESSLTDDEIITRVLSGEKNLYALLIRRYNQRLYRVAMSIVNDDVDAEEMMQATYIKAWENLGKFQYKSAFSTWMTRILINECLLRLKQRKRETFIPFNTPGAEINNVEAMSKQQTPRMKSENTELKKILEKTISELPEKYRTVFVMREIENMNVDETKDCLGISESNVKVRLNRAKSMLKDLLSAYYKKEELLEFHLSRCDRMVDAVMNRINMITTWE
jgi:RNA polymerase sigma-70 factor (ECF subfamily)